MEATAAVLKFSVAEGLDNLTSMLFATLTVDDISYGLTTQPSSSDPINNCRDDVIDVPLAQRVMAK
jgi:hypothetical protein